jgi:hypothetical protein
MNWRTVRLVPALVLCLFLASPGTAQVALGDVVRQVESDGVKTCFQYGLNASAQQTGLMLVFDDSGDLDVTVSLFRDLTSDTPTFQRGSLRPRDIDRVDVSVAGSPLQTYKPDAVRVETSVEQVYIHDSDLAERLLSATGDALVRFSGSSGQRDFLILHGVLAGLASGFARDCLDRAGGAAVAGAPAERSDTGAPSRSDTPQAVPGATLFSAIQAEDVGVVAAGLASGADVDAVDEYGQTPLMYATAKNRLDIVRLLIDAGADVNVRSLAGWTTLHYAARDAESSLVEALLEAGADIQIRNADGLTPEEVASAHGNGDAVAALRRGRSTDATSTGPIEARGADAMQATTEACLASRSGECAVRVGSWTVEVRNDAVEGRRVTVTGRPSSVASILGGSAAGELVFSCRNSRFDVYIKTTGTLLRNSSIQTVWKFDSGATHDRHLWSATTGLNFAPLFVPASLRDVFLSEARSASGSLTVRTWFFQAEDTIYATDGLASALQAIHCR